MNRRSIAAFLVFLMFFGFAASTVARAEMKEGMPQGEFALELVKIAGVLNKLTPGATGQDAINFLTKVGVVPEKGWDAASPVTKEWLASFFPDDPTKANLSFQALVDAIIAFVESSTDNTRSGVFPVQGASGSVPA